MSVTAEQGPQQCKTQTDLSVFLFGLKEVTMWKADTWFLFSIKHRNFLALYFIIFMMYELCLNVLKC